MSFSVASLFSGGGNQNSGNSQGDPNNQGQSGPAQTGPGSPGNMNQPGSNQNRAAPNNPTKQSARTDANGVVPNNESNNDNSADNTPLSKYKDLWEPSKNQDDNSGKSPFADLTPERIAEKAKEVDFSQLVSNEDMAAISQGGENAAAVFKKSLNLVAQKAYGQSAHASVRIAEAAYNRAKKDIMADLPAQIRKHTATSTIRGANPAFDNPAVKPIIHALSTQLANKFPHATTQQLQEMAKEYLSGAAELFNGSKDKNEEDETGTNPGRFSSGGGKTKSKGENWEKFFGEPQQDE